MRTQEIDSFFESLFKMKQAIKVFSAQCSLEERLNSVVQMEALTFIGSHPSVTVSALAAYLGISLSSATQLVDRLVQAGLVVREHDKEDRRVVNCLISEAGRQDMARLRTEMREKMERALAALPDHDLADLARIFRVVAEKLSESTDLTK